MGTLQINQVPATLTTKKISELTSVSSPDGSEVAPVVKTGSTQKTPVPASAGGSSPAMARGLVSGSGTLQSGSVGIASVSKEGTGEYLVTFENGFFSGTPIVVVSCWQSDSNVKVLAFTNPSGTEVTVIAMNSDLSTPSDSPFSILAIAPGS